MHTTRGDNGVLCPSCTKWSPQLPQFPQLQQYTQQLPTTTVATTHLNNDIDSFKNVFQRPKFSLATMFQQRHQFPFLHNNLLQQWSLTMWVSAPLKNHTRHVRAHKVVFSHDWRWSHLVWFVKTSSKIKFPKQFKNRQLLTVHPAGWQTEMSLNKTYSKIQTVKTSLMHFHRLAVC